MFRYLIFPHLDLQFLLTKRPYPGDARQYANCHYVRDETKHSCSLLGVKNQVKVRQCHTACRPRPNQRGKDKFIFHPEDGMPDIPSHKNVRKKWKVYAAGEKVELPCVKDLNQTLSNLPVTVIISNYS